MARESQQFDRDFRKWEAQLMRAVQPATFHRKVQEKHLPEIVNAIVGSAKAWIRPENNRYAAYKPSYRKNTRRTSAKAARSAQGR